MGESSKTIDPLPPTVIPRAILAQGPETVINPEGRPAPAPKTDPAVPASSIVRMLFPSTESEFQHFRGELGLMVGHFRIVDRIRSGGMGAVFKALDTRLNRIVAIKILPPGQSRDPAAVQRFKNEAQAAAQLDHENIARVFYIGEEDGLNFIAFEFVQGTNIRELIQQHRRLPLEDAVNYTLQIASALLHTSAQGIVHRDIKPSNIIITPGGRAKLVDLGLARTERPGTGDDLTVPGTTLGTFDYISPEQAYDPRTADIRSDIYSLGCTLYHMLTGEPPYPEGTVMQKLLQHQGDDAPDPVGKNRRVPEGLSAVTRKMMAKEPRRRYQTAEQLMRDLMLVAGSMGLRSVSPEGLLWMSSTAARGPFWERHLAWMATVAALLAMVGYLEYGRDPAPNSPPRPHESAQAEAKGPLVAANLPNRQKQSDKETEVHPVIPASVAETPEETVTEVVPVPLKPPAPSATSSPAALLTMNGTVAFGPAMTDGQHGLQPLFNPDTLTKLGPELLSSKAVAVVESVKVEPPLVPEIPLPSENSVKPALPAPPADLLASAPIVMRSSFGPPQMMSTLAAACAQADDGTVIELRYNGARTEGPLRISKKVTIVAGKGFRPKVEFVPRNELADGDLTRMITVTSGALEMVGIDLEMSPDDLVRTEFWSFFTLHRPDSLRLKSVTLTLRNPRQLPAAFIELPAGLSSSMADMGVESMARSPLRIEMEGSLIRGSSDFLLTRTLEPLRVELRDSVVAIQGSLLHSRGEMQPRASEAKVELSLDHLTAALGKGVLQLECGDSTRRVLPVQISASNSIISTPTGDPLISMSGNLPAAEYRRMLAWSGQKNFYDQVRSFWTTTSTQAGKDQPEVLDFAGWQKFWGPAADVDPRATPVIWRVYWESRSFADLSPADFALDRASNNPAVSGASTRNDAGADLDALQKLGIRPVASPASGS